MLKEPRQENLKAKSISRRSFDFHLIVLERVVSFEFRLRRPSNLTCLRVETTMVLRLGTSGCGIASLCIMIFFILLFAALTTTIV